MEVDVRNALLITINIFLITSSPASLLRGSAALTVGDEPLQGDVDIVLLFTADGVAADLTILNQRLSSGDMFSLIKPESRSSSFSLSDRSHPAHLGRSE